MIRIDVVDAPRLPADISRKKWGDMMTDVHLWQPVLNDICSAINLEFGVDVLAGYPGSCAVFVVGEKAVIKVFPPLFADDFAVELAAYELLHGRVAAMPALLASGIYRDRIEWPFLVLEFCPGEPIRTLHAHLSPQEKMAIAQEVGKVIQAVHQTAVLPQDPFKPWEAFLKERYPTCLDELRRTTPLPDYLVSEIEWFLAQMAPELKCEPAVLVNADLTDDHVLLSQEDGVWRPSAIIDWADVEIAPSAYEWIAAWFGFCRMDAAMFRALVSACESRQPFDDLFRRKLLAMTLLHRFGPLIIRERWQDDPPAETLTLQSLSEWLWPGIINEVVT